METDGRIDQTADGGAHSPEALAAAIAVPIGDLGGRFMLSGRTYAAGAAAGFSGLDFYFCGRAGVLGPVDADVVTTELGFFEPGNVRRQWEAGLTVMDPAEAAQRFIGCGYDWAHARLPDDLDAGRLAELATAVADGTGDEQPALFRGWREFPRPEDDTERALHGIHLLRELRGGQHVHAAHGTGLAPHDAVTLHTGDANAELFGWSAPHPTPDATTGVWAAAAAWEETERRTNDAMVVAFAVLSPAEQLELLALARAAVPG